MNKKWLAIALFIMAGATGCKQAIGQRCQVDDDCGSGVCSMASPKVCVAAGTDMSGIDGKLPPDAQDIDAAAVNGGN